MGPIPWPKLDAVLIPASTYLQAFITALTTSMPLARFDAIAATVVRKHLSRGAGRTYRPMSIPFHEYSSNFDMRSRFSLLYLHQT